MHRLAKIPVVAIVTLLLGMMLLTEFYTHLALGHFTVAGFTDGIHTLAGHDLAPDFWKSGLLWVGARSAFFAPFLAPCLAVVPVCLILLIARRALLWITTLIFLIYWVSYWVYPGIWIFEFLFPLTFAFCAACASRGESLIGTKLFGNFSLTARLIIMLLASALLWYVIILSKNAGAFTTRVAWQTSLSFAFLFTISAFLERARQGELTETPWTAIMILSIAAMMVLQVFADQAVGFYTTEGYANLVDSYAKQASAPDWFKAFLKWSAQSATFLMPIQAIFEAGVAIFLTLLLLRGPALLALTGMFVVFAFSEFGVQAEMPGSPIFTYTGTWEMLFVTVASLFIGLQQLAARPILLGPPLFGKIPLIARFGIALLAGLALFLAGIATHVFTTDYFTTSWLGGASFALLLAIRAVIDPTMPR